MRDYTSLLFLIISTFNSCDSNFINKSNEQSGKTVYAQVDINSIYYFDQKLENMSLDIYPIFLDENNKDSWYYRDSLYKKHEDGLPLSLEIRNEIFKHIENEENIIDCDIDINGYHFTLNDIYPSNPNFYRYPLNIFEKEYDNSQLWDRSTLEIQSIDLSHDFFDNSNNLPNCLLLIEKKFYIDKILYIRINLLISPEDRQPHRPAISRPPNSADDLWTPPWRTDRM
jgi:hypothetical protein